MYSHKIIISGDPFGKQRPRFAKTGAVYMPTETKAYMKKVAWTWATVTHGERFHGLVRVDIKAYFPVPKSVTKSAREAMLDGTRRPNRKPDGDNIEKIIWDGLQEGGAFDDDKAVVSWTGEKWYSEEPRVEVTVTEI